MTHQQKQARDEYGRWNIGKVPPGEIARILDGLADEIDAMGKREDITPVAIAPPIPPDPDDAGVGFVGWTLIVLALAAGLGVAIWLAVRP